MDSAQESNASDVSLTINRSIKFLHFSDGVEEELQEEKISELQSAPQKNENEDVDTKSMAWGPWLSYYAWKSGSKVLSAVDTAGESLASVFGITTPKYQIEINEYERMQEEKKKMEEESTGWVPKNTGGDVPLVLDEPVKDIERAENA